MGDPPSKRTRAAITAQRIDLTSDGEDENDPPQGPRAAAPPPAAAAAAAAAAAQVAAKAKAKAEARSAQTKVQAAANAAAADAEKRAKDAASRLLKQLECPVCLSTMMPPIRQCANGHTICDKCSQTPACTHCPVCRIDAKPYPRNLALEQMAADLPIKCAHSACSVTVKYGDHADHLKKCSYRPLHCLFGLGCTKVIDPVDSISFMTHLLEKHGAVEVRADASGFAVNSFVSQPSNPFHPLAWPPVLVWAHGKAHFLWVERDAPETYKVTLFGIGHSTSKPAEISVRHKAAPQNMFVLSNFYAEDFLQFRRLSHSATLYVSASTAHWCSQKNEANETDLRVSLCIPK